MPSQGRVLTHSIFTFKEIKFDVKKYNSFKNENNLPLKKWNKIKHKSCFPDKEIPLTATSFPFHFEIFPCFPCRNWTTLAMMAQGSFFVFGVIIQRRPKNVRPRANCTCWRVIYVRTVRDRSWPKSNFTVVEMKKIRKSQPTQSNFFKSRSYHQYSSISISSEVIMPTDRIAKNYTTG